MAQSLRWFLTLFQKFIVSFKVITAYLIKTEIRKALEGIAYLVVKHSALKIRFFLGCYFREYKLIYNCQGKVNTT